ncbi:DUF2515 domain-containing protein [Anaerobacillus arseniciselenatis]|uniref:DUF2515 domain-containing protein n=1 Tax=Anaerobacillus arseniciselenatis TaxID=85682 RepID=UPI0009FE66DE|nr:DUF2515 domain-containing protein [Anaerobacillus arseniciselenatis]
MIDGIINFIKKGIQLPKAGYEFLLDEREAKKYEKNSVVRWNELSFQEDRLIAIDQQLRNFKHEATPLTQADRRLVGNIHKKTSELNRNNVTRTKAYLDYYKKHPEVHWAFLAHLVSRNGGWNMTDLKGSILDRVLSNDAREHFFSFLERANALIFHDAYRQLLLYEASKERNKSLFYLLPKLGVSRFMRPFWNDFFENKNSQLLTVALIINEQHYIEKRVVHHPSFKEKVLNNIIFQLQDVLQFTYVLFPFNVKDRKMHLTGTTVSDFTNVEHRIEIGKKLYCQLFGIENLYSDISKFAMKVKHTGSRNDYWSSMFTKSRQEKLDMTSLSCRPKKPIIFSPVLEDAWEDVRHSFTDESDWYQVGSEITPFFSKTKTPTSFDLTMKYCRDVHKMVVASNAMKIIKN